MSGECARLLNAHKIGPAPPGISAVTAIEQAQSPFPPKFFLNLRLALGKDAAGNARSHFLKGDERASRLV